MPLRPLLPVLLLLALTSTAAAAPQPLRIDIECQDYGRTKACPSFLLGFVEHDPLFLSSPRASAQVVLYVGATQVANDDHLHLRFVGDVAGAPPVIELDVTIDTRADDDTQRAQLQPAFDRGVALYVAALDPDAVTVTLAATSTAPIEQPKTSPWGYEADLSTFGSWTHNYKSFNAFGSLGVTRIEKDSSYGVSIGGDYGASRSPPVIEPDGTMVSFNTDQYSLSSGLQAEHVISGRWSGAVVSSIYHDDPHGQYVANWSARAGVEWDRYPADDPRGNHLAVAYLAGWELDKYHQPTEDGSRFFSYPIHGIYASGTVRKDKISYGLGLQISGEVIHPERRHTLSASPFVSIQIGSHLDVSFDVSVTERALVAPVVDPADYQSVSRAAYAEPLSASGSFSLRFHWDRTNGQRNDRFGNI